MQRRPGWPGRCKLIPAHCTVKPFDCRIEYPELPQARRGFTSQFRQSFYCKYPAGNIGENRGLVARAAPISSTLSSFVTSRSSVSRATI